MAYTVTWLEIDCEKCEKANWVRLGNLDDQTMTDVTHYRCWHCGQVCPVSDVVENEYESDDYNQVDGLVKP